MGRQADSRAPRKERLRWPGFVADEPTIHVGAVPCPCGHEGNSLSRARGRGFQVRLDQRPPAVLTESGSGDRPEAGRELWPALVTVGQGTDYRKSPAFHQKNGKISGRHCFSQSALSLHSALADESRDAEDVR